jgi:hypothetical protein
VLLLFAWFVLTVAPDTLSGDPAHFARVKMVGLAVGGVAVAASALFFTLAGHPERMGRIALRIERVLPARLAHIVARFVETFSQGLAVMRQPGRMLISLVLSVPLWLAIATGIWLTSQAFHITFPFQASFLVITFLAVGVAMPTPGAVGGFHLAYTTAAVWFFAAPPDRAVGAAILLHAISFVPVTLLGIYFMAREGLTLAGARRMVEERSAAGPQTTITGPEIGREAEGRAR